MKCLERTAYCPPLRLNSQCHSPWRCRQAWLSRSWKACRPGGQGNLLDDIKEARNIRLVVKEGVAHDPKTLPLSVEGKIGPAGPDDHEDWELDVKPLRAQASGPLK